MDEVIKMVALELEPCFRKRSGIGTYAYELTKRLGNDGNLRFCGNLFNCFGKKLRGEYYRDFQMPIRECRMLPYGIYRRIWHILPLHYDAFFRNPADLNIFFDFIVPPHIKGKVMTTIHDLSFYRFPEFTKVSNRRRIVKDIAYSVERCSRVITISEFSKAEIMELLDVPEKKISIISPAPSIADETADLSLLRLKYGIGAKYLLYVGTIEPRKNLIRLIKAFSILKERYNIPHQLVLAGGMGWNNEEFEKAISENRAKKHVCMTGYISDAEKNCLYQNASLFVFPSIYEGFGIPPLEAMHWGCPVVTANAASLPEVVGAAAELVDPYDTEQMAEGIYRVLSDIDRRSELIRLGYAREKKFTWDASARRFLEVCREVLTEV